MRPDPMYGTGSAVALLARAGRVARGHASRRRWPASRASCSAPIPFASSAVSGYSIGPSPSRSIVTSFVPWVAHC